MKSQTLKYLVVYGWTLLLAVSLGFLGLMIYDLFTDKPENPVYRIEKVITVEHDRNLANNS